MSVECAWREREGGAWGGNVGDGGVLVGITGDLF